MLCPEEPRKSTVTVQRESWFDKAFDMILDTWMMPLYRRLLSKRHHGEVVSGGRQDRWLEQHLGPFAPTPSQCRTSERE
jgi:hypothetical protein